MTEKSFKKLSVVIPCYNEKNSISEIINQVKNVVIPLEKEIIIVGDFSFNIYEAKAASDDAGDIEFMKTQIYASWIKENGQEKEDSFEVTVPEGHVFMLSDNLPGSRDSRETGPYPIENVISKIL